MNSESSKQKVVVCKFREDCKNKGTTCKFYHPERICAKFTSGNCAFGHKCQFKHVSPQVNSPHQVSPSPSPSPSHNPRPSSSNTPRVTNNNNIINNNVNGNEIARLPKMCLSDIKCYKRDCKYRHTSQFCGREMCTQHNCNKRHPKCPLGVKCADKKCKNHHFNENICDLECKIVTCPKRHPAERNLCRFGSKCFNFGCTFVHPDPSKRKLCTCRNPETCLKMHKEDLLLTIGESNNNIKKQKLELCNNALQLQNILLLGKKREYQEAVQKVETLIGVEHMIASEEIRKIEQDLKLLHNQRSQFYAEANELLKLASIPNMRLSREIFRLVPRNYKAGVAVNSTALPALGLRQDLATQIKNNRIIVIKGETGSGKSTQVPQYLADIFFKSGEKNQLKVLCTQPRKIAAISLANRVEYEFRGGDSKYFDTKSIQAKNRYVGYSVGGQKVHGKAIEYCTQEILLKLLLSSDPLKKISRYSVIVIDEAHERSISTDLILGLMKKLYIENPNLQLRLIVTSATLDTAKFQKYFREIRGEQVPLVEIPGRLYPVTVDYHPRFSHNEKIVPSAVDLAIKIHCNPEATGDILVFLTGQDDVEAAEKLATQKLKQIKHLISAVKIYTLYGKQIPDEQNRVFETVDCRKIIFSTNVAETSLTIDGVCHVIDCGFEKEATFDYQRNMTILDLGVISQSSAKQRQGRAGRTAPGKCYRLYSEDEFNNMNISQKPEILKSALFLTILGLKAKNISVEMFDWIDPPEKENVRSTIEQLKLLEALSPTGELTEFGRLIVDLQVDPIAAKIIYTGKQLNLLKTSIRIASIMGIVDNLFWRGGSDEMKKEASKKRQKFVESNAWNEFGDLEIALYTYNMWKDIEYVSNSNNNNLISSSDSVDSFDDENLEIGDAGYQTKSYQSLSELTSDDLCLLNTDFESASESSDVSDVSYQDEKEIVKVKKLSKFERIKRQKKLCLQNSLNQKSLSIAENTEKDLQFLLQKLFCNHDANNNNNVNSKKNSKRYPEISDSRIPSPSEVRKLLLSGLYPNICVKQQRSAYYAVISDTSAFIHPSSNLNPIKQNASYDYVVYNTMMRTKKTYIQNITPVNISDLQSIVSNSVYSRIHQALSSKVIKSEVIQCRPSVIELLFGKNFMKLSSIERQCSSSLEIDTIKGEITIWANQNKIIEAVKTLKLMIEDVTQKLFSERYVYNYAGKTRVVYESGCTVKMILLEGEYVELLFENIPMEYTEDQFIAYVERVVRFPIRSNLHQAIDFQRSNNSKSCWAKFSTKEITARIFNEFKCQVNAQNVIKCSPGICSISSESSQENTVEVRISSATSSRTAILTFQREDSVRAVVNNKNWAMNFGVDVQESQPKNIDQSSEKKRKGYDIYIRNIPAGWDEQEITDRFETFGKILHCKLKRGNQPSAGDDHSIALSTVRSYISFNQDAIYDSHLEFNKHNVDTVQWRVGSLNTAFTVMNSIDQAGLMVCNLPVRVKVRLLHVFTFNLDLYKKLFNEFKSLKTLVMDLSFLFCYHQKDEAKDKISIQLKASFSGRKANDQLKAWNAIIQRYTYLLTPTVYESPDRFALFSYRGRQEMKNVEQQTNCHIHWDNKTKMIRIYGVDSKREQVRRKLDQFVASFASSQTELYYSKQYSLPVRTFVKSLLERDNLLDNANNHNNAPSSTTTNNSKRNNNNNNNSGTPKKMQKQNANSQNKGRALEPKITDKMQANFKSNTIYIWEKADIPKIMQLFTSNNIPLLTQKPQQRHKDNNNNNNHKSNVCTKDECSECGDIPSNPKEIISLSSCDHKYCVDCFNHQMLYSELFPLSCTACGKPFILRDILSNISADDFYAILRRSMREYLKCNSNTIRNCYSADCPQIFSPQRSIDSFKCDQCFNEYCIKCSDKKKSGVFTHLGISCAEFQGQDDLSLQFIKTMPKCPKCGNPIEKNGGCWHMTCVCGCHFCWGCFGIYPSNIIYDHMSKDCTYSVHKRY